MTGAHRAPSHAATTPAAPRHPFVAALAARDLDSAIGALAPEVVLYPPVSDHPFEGREEVAVILRMLLTQELDYIECLDEVRAEDRIAARFRVGIGGRDVDVLDFLRLDGQDKVCEYRVFARPLAEAAGYLAAVGPAIARRRGRGRALVIKMLSAPLPTLLALADRAGSRYAR